MDERGWLLVVQEVKTQCAVILGPAVLSHQCSEMGPSKRPLAFSLFFLLLPHHCFGHFFFFLKHQDSVTLGSLNETSIWPYEVRQVAALLFIMC